MGPEVLAQMYEPSSDSKEPPAQTVNPPSEETDATPAADTETVAQIASPATTLHLSAVTPTLLPLNTAALAMNPGTEVAVNGVSPPPPQSELEVIDASDHATQPSADQPCRTNQGYKVS